MARSRHPPDTTKPSLTADRAARLCRLVRLLGEKPRTRTSLLRQLRLDDRGFYRDIHLLREVGILVEAVEGKYALRGDPDDAVLRIPLPDPRLTLGEATQLARGRTAAHRKVKQVLAQILPE
jgi:hypothetical protein